MPADETASKSCQKRRKAQQNFPKILLQWAAGVNFAERQVAGQLQGKVTSCCDREGVHRGAQKWEFQALGFDLLTHEKPLSAHHSQRSVTLLMGMEPAQFSSRIAVDLQGQRGNGDRGNSAGQVGPSTEEKTSLLEALGQKKPMGQWQTEKGAAGRTGVIDFHLSRLFRELASVTVPLIF